MKEIKLKRMSLENFKGFRTLDAQFADGMTTVRGANGTGKTTLIDAFLWCLFGKDHNGRTDFEIKTKDDGKVLERLDHAVRITLTINGNEVTFCRTLAEKWVKPRGKAEAEFQGNETKYLYNGIEIKASAYSARVSEVIDEQLFRLLTTPSYFASLDWQKRREILIRIAGDVTLEEAAAGREDMAKIVADLSGKSLAEFRQELAYRRKRIREELEKCPVQVRAIEDVMPQEPDYAMLEERKAQLDTAIADKDAAIRHAADAAQAEYDRQKQAFDAINAMRMRQTQLIADERNRRQLEYMEKNSEAELAKNAVANTSREHVAYMREAEATIEDHNIRIERIQNDISRYTAEREQLVKRWEARNAETYQRADSGVRCPLSGKPCTDPEVIYKAEKSQAEAAQAFEAAKDKDLNDISASGKDLNDKLEAAKKNLAELSAHLEEVINKTSLDDKAYQARIAELTHKAESVKVVEIDMDVKGEDIPEWVELQRNIDSMQANVDDDGAKTASGVVDALQAERKTLESERDEIRGLIATKKQADEMRGKIDDIKRRERELAQQMADIEGVEFSAEALNKARMDKVEERVNKMFRHVRFSLFAEQINGGITDACDILVGKNLVKYGSGANNAGEINAGLDIINTLSAYHGVTAPIFIDNAESVTDLIPVSSQMIRLVVDADKKQLEITL